MTVPDLGLTPDDRDRGYLTPEQLARAKRAYASEHCLFLPEVWPVDWVDDLRAAVDRDFGDRPEDAASVGADRYMVNVPVDGPYANPYLYANPLFFEILQELLGPHLALLSFGAVFSPPGSADQKIHLDHPQIFRDHPEVHPLPPYAVSLIIPLVDSDATTGSTRIWPGEQHWFDPENADPADGQLVVAPRGSCILLDYRVVHHGTANLGATRRSLLYLVYARPWFQDYVNYYAHEPLQMSLETYRRVPEALRELFFAVGNRLARVHGDPAIRQV